MPLSDTAARSAKPREKAYKLSDEKGLYLQVDPNGSKFWRLKYRFAKRNESCALAAIPR
jgi:Arm DNA-binding domain